MFAILSLILIPGDTGLWEQNMIELGRTVFRHYMDLFCHIESSWWTICPPLADSLLRFGKFAELYNIVVYLKKKGVLYTNHAVAQ